MTLAADQPFEEAAAVIIAERTAAVFEQRANVLGLRDIEPVHAMRVATRRLRASLEVFDACLHRRRRASTLKAVKALADALGERRDRDVQLVRLQVLRARTSGPERRAVELLGRELRREQRRANRRLAKALAHAKGTRLRKRLARLAP
jgi:CHAD domain-containing protein